jgi:3-hydroxyisobutyrate dehydrogenase-like beta-hydroxyacid dehydrogenase
MSTITFIGTGTMARTIGTLAVAGGNTVEIMGRDRSKAEALATALGGGPACSSPATTRGPFALGVNEVTG